MLEYVPSNLEICKPGIILEGKNDFYTLNYFFNVILKKNEIALIPGMCCTNADTLISLYSGWGKEFFVFLDSDEGGQKGKKRYKEQFGAVVENRIYSFEDIDSSWTRDNMESILENSEKLKIQQSIFPEMKRDSKKAYNKAIQELYTTSTSIDISEAIIEKFRKIYEFMENLYK